MLALAGTAPLAELDPGQRWSEPYRLDGIGISTTSMAITALPNGGLVLLTEPGSLLPARIPRESVVAIGWLAAAAGQLLTVASVQLIPATRSAAFLLRNPITATVLAAALLGERPAPLQVAGGGLMPLGIAAASVPIGLVDGP